MRSREIRDKSADVSKNMIRISVGFEHIEDIKQDFETA